MDQAVVPAEHAPVHVHDLAGLGGAGAQLLHDAGIGAVRHEADVLAIGLVGDREGKARGEPAGLRLGQIAQREAQERELLRGGREQEIALVALRVAGAVQLDAPAIRDPAHVMPGRQRIRTEIARHPQQICELDALVAAHAGIGVRPAA